jgi:hypothetical protein
MNTDYNAGLIATTGDYEVSWIKWSNLWRIISVLELEIKAIDDYQKAKDEFDGKLVEFKGHAGADGIQEAILSMEKDLETATAEGDARKHSTALAILNRSKPKWGDVPGAGGNDAIWTTQKLKTRLITVGFNYRF